MWCTGKGVQEVKGQRAGGRVPILCIVMIDDLIVIMNWRRERKARYDQRMKKLLPLLSCLLFVGCGEEKGGPLEGGLSSKEVDSVGGGAPSENTLGANIAGKIITFKIPEDKVRHQIQFNDDGTLLILGRSKQLEYRIESNEVLMFDEGVRDGGISFESSNPQVGNRAKMGTEEEIAVVIISKIENEEDHGQRIIGYWAMDPQKTLKVLESFPASEGLQERKGEVAKMGKTPSMIAHISKRGRMVLYNGEDSPETVTYNIAADDDEGTSGWIGDIGAGFKVTGDTLQVFSAERSPSYYTSLFSRISEEEAKRRLERTPSKTSKEATELTGDEVSNLPPLPETVTKEFIMGLWAKAHDGSEIIEELANDNIRVGVWKVGIGMGPNKRELIDTSEATMTVKIVDRRFQVWQWSVGQDIGYSFLTYDYDRKRYRWWSALSDGFIMEWSGRRYWRNLMEWNTVRVPEEDMRMTARWMFLSEDRKKLKMAGEIKRNDAVVAYRKDEFTWLSELPDEHKLPEAD